MFLQTERSVTHVDPAQRDEVVLVLDEEELLLVFRVAVVRPAALLRDDDVSHRERVSGLKHSLTV